MGDGVLIHVFWNQQEVRLHVLHRLFGKHKALPLLAMLRILIGLLFQTGSTSRQPGLIKTSSKKAKCGSMTSYKSLFVPKMLSAIYFAGSWACLLRSQIVRHVAYVCKSVLTDFELSLCLVMVNRVTMVTATVMVTDHSSWTFKRVVRCDILRESS